MNVQSGLAIVIAVFLPFVSTTVSKNVSDLAISMASDLFSWYGKQVTWFGFKILTLVSPLARVFLCLKPTSHSRAQQVDASISNGQRDESKEKGRESNQEKEASLINCVLLEYRLGTFI